jgi:hypothetical protein
MPAVKNIGIEPATREEPLMKKAMVVLLAVLVLASVVSAPGDAWAWRGGCCWWPGAVVGGLALGAALAFPYPYYYPPYYPSYYPSPVVYQQPATYVSAPPPVAVQREVVFPNGKYVLYGDGVTQPWQWVWVEAPPAGPPPPPTR